MLIYNIFPKYKWPIYAKSFIKDYLLLEISLLNKKKKSADKENISISKPQLITVKNQLISHG